MALADLYSGPLYLGGNPDGDAADYFRKAGTLKPPTVLGRPAPSPVNAEAPNMPTPNLGSATMLGGQQSTQIRNPLQDQAPQPLTGKRKALAAIFAGMGAFKSPELGQQIYNEEFVAPQERYQKQEEQQQADIAKQREAASRESLQGAQTQEAQARANALNNPQAADDKAAATVSSGGQAYQWDTGTGKYDIPIGKPIVKEGQAHYQTDAKGNLHEITIGPDGKPVDQIVGGGYAIPGQRQGAYGQFGSAYVASRMLLAAYDKNPALLPVIAPVLGNMMQQPDMTPEQKAELRAVLAQLPAGQPRNASGTPIGTGMPEAPTGSTRSRGQFAQAVIPSIDDAKRQIASLGAQLGPMAGRWNDLYKGKIGAYGPQFSGLQTTLKNIGTAWMRLHANSEKARQDFEGMLRASQDPANLIANLDAIEKQAQDYATAGQGKPNELGGGTQGGAGAFKVGDSITQGGRTYRVTKVDKDGKVLEAQ